MALSTRDKLIVLAVLVAVAIFLIVNSVSSKSAVENDGSLSYTGQVPDNNNNNNNNQTFDNDTKSDNSSLSKKFKTRDSSSDGNYKHSSYSEGNRTNPLNDLDKFFENTSPFDEHNDNNMSGFDDNGDAYAQYKGGKTRTFSDEDKFNSAELLPKEKKYDWFDDSQATPVANSHLINTTRPAGVNTVLSTKKIGCRDIRGIIPNPRIYIGPWNMSSVEPDSNIKSGALC